MLSSPSFQRRAARTPLIRLIARREARALFDLCAGAVYAQTLVACLRLDLFERLATPLTPAALAEACALPLAGATALLNAAVALRLADRRGPAYGLGLLGASLRANPGIAAMVAHHDRLYDDLRDPIALLRAPPGTTQLAAYWSYAANPQAAALPADAVAPYGALMAASQPMIADQILAAYDLTRHRALLDIGGGEGRFLMAAAQAAPALALHLFDLPQVTARATQTLAARATCHPGDFRRDPIPPVADLITLIRVLHDHDDATIRPLLAAIHAALPPGGRILIAEPLADTPSVAAYFSLYLRAMGSGRPRTAAELRTLLREAGFTRPRLLPTPIPLIAQVMIADRR